MNIGLHQALYVNPSGSTAHLTSRSSFLSKLNDLEYQFNMKMNELRYSFMQEANWIRKELERIELERIEIDDRCVIAEEENDEKGSDLEFLEEEDGDEPYCESDLEIPYICDECGSMFLNQEQAFDFDSEGDEPPLSPIPDKSALHHNIRMISNFRENLKNLVDIRFPGLIRRFSLRHVKSNHDHDLLMKLVLRYPDENSNEIYVPVISNEDHGRISRLRFNFRLCNQEVRVDSDFFEHLS